VTRKNRWMKAAVRPRMCPSNHKLPNSTPKGECTPLYCALGTTLDIGKAKKAAKPKETKALPATTKRKERVTTASEEVNDALARMEERLALSKAKRKHFGLTDGLEGADAEDWADKKLTALLPVAVAELEEQLTLGTPDERFRAATRVLDATGRGKREMLNNSGPSIVIVGAEVKDGQVVVPWAQRLEDGKA
jgi:hypothetical protein